MDGDVIGMNFYDRRIGTPFLSWECICNILGSLKGKMYSSASHMFLFWNISRSLLKEV